MFEATLTKHFPVYGLQDTSCVWTEVQRDYHCGQEVSGMIIARFPFGVAVDFGAHLPGILLVTRIPDITPARFEPSAEYQAGARLEASIECFAVQQNQIGLSAALRDGGDDPQEVKRILICKGI